MAQGGMDGLDGISGSNAEQMVERGTTYDHAVHGEVEITGIWKGVTRADSAHQTTDSGTIIVRYSTEHDGKSVTELTDTLDEFLEAVES